MRRTVIVWVMLWLAAGHAVAQDKPEGTRLFDEGRELAKQGRYEEACARFEQSLALDRAPGTALNYGDCLERLGQLREAWQMFDEAATAFGAANDARAAYARERASTVESKLAVVVIKVAEPELDGLVILVGEERAAPAAEIVTRWDPGELAVSVGAPGRTAFEQTVRGVAGQRVIVEVPVLAAIERPAEVTERPVLEETARSKSRVKLAFGVAGVGAAALVGSGVLGLLARSQYTSAVDDECTRTGAELVCSPAGAERVDSAASKANIATGLAIGGGVLVAAGVVVYMTAPKERMVVAPTAGASSVGFALSGRF